MYRKRYHFCSSSERFTFHVPISQGKRKMNDEAENEPPPKQQRIRKQVHDELDGFSGASDDEGSESAAPVMCSRLALFIN